ncbi:hypothetical protein BCF59_0690 [Mycoplasmopsis mustelae]|uniref:Uncharacterized protein n=2 Tax=Mycoplasmopsis mustelae TaxID=171289 RepID=A0A4R7UE85_9BACT|nr:hypothetical protein BCF59_0690 [Mycoplasmopsis mustelae]
MPLISIAAITTSCQKKSETPIEMKFQKQINSLSKLGLAKVLNSVAVKWFDNLDENKNAEIENLKKQNPKSYENLILFKDSNKITNFMDELSKNISNNPNIKAIKDPLYKSFEIANLYNLNINRAFIGRFISIFNPKDEEIEEIINIVKFSEKFTFLNNSSIFFEWINDSINSINNSNNPNNLNVLSDKIKVFERNYANIVNKIFKNTDNFEYKKAITEIDAISKEIKNLQPDIDQFARIYQQTKYKKENWSYTIGSYYKDSISDYQNNRIENYKTLSKLINETNDKSKKEELNKLKNLLTERKFYPENNIENDVDYDFFINIKNNDDILKITFYNRDQNNNFKLNDFDFDDNNDSKLLSEKIPAKTKHFAKVSLVPFDFKEIISNNLEFTNFNPPQNLLREINPYKISTFNSFSVDQVSFKNKTLKINLISSSNDNTNFFKSNSFESLLYGKNYALVYDTDTFIKNLRFDLYFEIPDDFYNYIYQEIYQKAKKFIASQPKQNTILLQDEINKLASQLELKITYD